MNLVKCPSNGCLSYSEEERVCDDCTAQIKQYARVKQGRKFPVVFEDKEVFCSLCHVGNKENTDSIFVSDINSKIVICDTCVSLCQELIDEDRKKRG